MECFKRHFLIKFGFIIFLALAFLASSSIAAENPFPWKYGGYQNVNELYLKYWSVDREALQDFQNFVKDELKSTIIELWFSKNPARLRVDKYVESSSIKCDQFKGKAWEKITFDGKIYVLAERLVQIDTRSVFHRLANIETTHVDGERTTDICEYKKETGTKRTPSLKDALIQLTVVPYIAEPKTEEMDISLIEYDKALNPQKYKETMEILKKRYEKAGRKTAQRYSSFGWINFTAEGFEYIDIDMGIGLESWLTGRKRIYVQPAATLKEPVCVYKIVTLKTKISDENVFGKWVD